MAQICTHVVIRPFDAEGRERQIGERVDASRWKNTDHLVNTRYLRAVTPADKRSPAPRTLARSVDTAAPRELKKFVVKKKR